jgi:hypothetical protein
VKAHIAKKHPDSGKLLYACDYCKRNFRSHKILMEHLERHKDDRRGHVCSKCSKMCSSKRTLKEHLKVHSSPKFSCRVCGKKFHTKGAQKSHQNTQHVDTTDQKCEFCNKDFGGKSVKTLKEHELYCDSNPEHPGPFRCPFPACGKFFTKRRQRNRHAKTCKGGRPAASST